MSRLQLAMIDVDGTLRTRDDWQPGALDLLATLGELGITTALCSGRPVASLVKIAADHPHITYVSAASGANVHRLDAGRWHPLHAVRLDPHVVDEVVAGAADAGLELWGYTVQDWLVPAENDLTRRETAIIDGIRPAVADLRGRSDLVKLLAVTTEDSHEHYLRSLDFPGVAVVASGPSLVDIVPASATADKGGAALIADLGIGWDAVVAIGDGENDIGMLSAAGIACALPPLDPAQVPRTDSGLTACADLAAVRAVIIGY